MINSKVCSYLILALPFFSLMNDHVLKVSFGFVSLNPVLICMNRQGPLSQRELFMVNENYH